MKLASGLKIWSDTVERFTKHNIVISCISGYMCLFYREGVTCGLRVFNHEVEAVAHYLLQWQL